MKRLNISFPFQSKISAVFLHLYMETAKRVQRNSSNRFNSIWFRVLYPHPTCEWKRNCISTQKTAERKGRTWMVLFMFHTSIQYIPYPQCHLSLLVRNLCLGVCVCGEIIKLSHPKNQFKNCFSFHFFFRWSLPLSLFWALQQTIHKWPHKK